ncbi:MAG: hypothetical protein IKP99_07195 [Bacteroidales bacterium]|nr:hypothetical protein [Bacteroidales bacterium]MBR6265205.1 hypothetical protein [Bacteroidales bacterium]
MARFLGISPERRMSSYWLMFKPYTAFSAVEYHDFVRGNASKSTSETAMSAFVFEILLECTRDLPVKYIVLFCNGFPIFFECSNTSSSTNPIRIGFANAFGIGEFVFYSTKYGESEKIFYIRIDKMQRLWVYWKIKSLLLREQIVELERR